MNETIVPGDSPSKSHADLLRLEVKQTREDFDSEFTVPSYEISRAILHQNLKDLATLIDHAGLDVNAIQVSLTKFALTSRST